jgi:hypothetical protein
MKASAFSLRTPALAVSLCFALNGCLLGPNFERPQSDTPGVFNRTQDCASIKQSSRIRIQPGMVDAVQ